MGCAQGGLVVAGGGRPAGRTVPLPASASEERSGSRAGGDAKAGRLLGGPWSAWGGGEGRQGRAEELNELLS